MDFMVNDDHWAFLDDIEAPMWVDLSLEANSNDQDVDDSWFYTSHQFHQCSSSQLKSAFSHFGDESTTLDSELLGPSSPKLPHSVSKSRGKEYRSKKWKGDNKDFSLDKSHPVKVLTAKSSCVKLGDRNKVKHKSSFVHLKETSTSKASVVCESSSSGKAVSSCSKPLSASGDPGSSLSSEANKTSESNPTSTITSESGQQQQLKVVDVSSHTFGHTNGLLSFMKKSLRKSYITTQAKRVEINNDEKQLMGRNSTSSKSSVGSSSNPRSDVRISMSMSVRPKEITPDSRNVARMTYVTKSKMNAAAIVKASAAKTEEGTSNNKRGGQISTSKPARDEAAKLKVQYRDSRSKALVPSRVNEKNPTLAAARLKKITGTSESRKLAVNGKENVTGRASVSQKKCSGRVFSSGEGIAGMGEKGTRQALSGKNDKAGTIHSKGQGRGQENLAKPKKLVQRVHFR